MSDQKSSSSVPLQSSGQFVPVLPAGEVPSLKKTETVETTTVGNTTETVVTETIVEPVVASTTTTETKKYGPPPAKTDGVDPANPFKTETTTTTTTTSGNKYAPPPKPVEVVEVKTVETVQTMPPPQPMQGIPPAQGYPPQGMPPQQVHVQQGYPPQGYPPQRMPQQPRPPQGPQALPSGLILAPGAQLHPDSQWAATGARPPPQQVVYGQTLANKNTREPLVRPANQPPCQGPPPPGKLWCLMCVGHGFRGNPPQPCPQCGTGGLVDAPRLLQAAPGSSPCRQCKGDGVLNPGDIPQASGIFESLFSGLAQPTNELRYCDICYGLGWAAPPGMPDPLQRAKMMQQGGGDPWQRGNPGAPWQG